MSETEINEIAEAVGNEACAVFKSNTRGLYHDLARVMPRNGLGIIHECAAIAARRVLTQAEKQQTPDVI